MSVFVELVVLMARILWVYVQSLAKWFMPAKYKSVEGEICLITGAGNGMGRLMALHFAKRKAKLILWDMDKDGNEHTGDLVRQLGGSVYTDTCDVSDKEEIRKAAARARKQFGDVTILINNAGVTYCKELLDLSEKQIETTFKVNTLAHFWINRQFLPSMLDNNHGHIVTVASTVGLFASPGMPDYCASKHAAVGFHQSLYFDLQNSGKTGIKTTLVCPYLVRTGMFQGVNISKKWLLPALKPEGCVETIMHAVLTDQPMVAIPRTMYLAYNMMTWLPMKVQCLTYAFTGADKAISKFKPNRPYQFDDP